MTRGEAAELAIAKRWPAHSTLTPGDMIRCRGWLGLGYGLDEVARLTGLLGRDIDLALWRGLGR